MDNCNECGLFNTEKSTICLNCKKTMKLTESEALFLGHIMGRIDGNDIERTYSMFSQHPGKVPRGTAGTLFRKLERCIEFSGGEFHGVKW